MSVPSLCLSKVQSAADLSTTVRGVLPAVVHQKSESMGSTVKASGKSPSELPANGVSRCVYKTRAGIHEGVPKAVNQDSFIIHPFATRGQYLFAVCDGHGPFGHEVSAFLKTRLPQEVATALMLCKRSSEPELELALRTGIKRTAAALAQSNIDLSFSGSTLACLLVVGSVLVAANVGDSRALIAQKSLNWGHHELTYDHKPNLPQEEARIRRCGGVVRPLFDKNGHRFGVDRVWLPTRMAPGLAMSRSLGDTVAATVGVINTPETKVYLKNRTDKFAIIATDGLWDVLSNTEAVNIVKRAWELGRTETCCEVLVKEAVNRWKRVDSSADDITVVVVIFKN